MSLTPPPLLCLCRTKINPTTTTDAALNAAKTTLDMNNATPTAPSRFVRVRSDASSGSDASSASAVSCTTQPRPVVSTQAAAVALATSAGCVSAAAEGPAVVSSDDVDQRAAFACATAPEFTLGAAAAAPAARAASEQYQQQQQVSGKCTTGMTVVMPVPASASWAAVDDVAMDSDMGSEDAGCASASCAGAAARAAIMGSYAGAACVASATDTVQCF